MYLCCDARTKARGLCGVAQVSESVRTLDFEASNDTWYHKVPFPSNGTSVAFNPPKWLVRRSGVYSLFVTVCLLWHEHGREEVGVLHRFME